MRLVTGATGIVGAHLVNGLLERGDAVRVLVRPNADLTVPERVLAHYHADAHERLARVEWVLGDVLDTDTLTEAMAGVDHVYHAAAIVSFAPRAAAHMHEVNVTGTANVVNAALEAGVVRLCHVSSIATIGRRRDGEPMTEMDIWDPDAPASPYAASKYGAEMEVMRGLAEGLDAVVVNPALIFGPGASGRSTLKMVERLWRGTRFYPPGSNGVVDARDVAEVCIRLMEQGPGGGERYILAGEGVSYRTLFTRFAEAFSHPPPSLETKRWMLELAWRFEAVRGLLTGDEPLVTRDTVRSATTIRTYSSAKVQARLGYTFRGLDELVANTARFVQGRHTAADQGAVSSPASLRSTSRA